MPRLPQNVGKYKILERLGKGGMSVVYKAEHPTLKTPVVIKKLSLKGDKAYRERFLREAALMMTLRHENVVSLFDHFKEGAGTYLVMEFVDGVTLGDLMIREGPIPPREAAWLSARVARALAHIHERGVVHRDVKPANVFIGSDGTVKLGDFGIAFRPDGDEGITAPGSALGTPTFMAPEQLEDARRADQRSDVWSFGVTLYELLSGRKFVGGPGPAAIRKALPRALRSWRYRLPSGTPGFLRRLLARCLRLSPERRYRDARPVMRLLDKAVGSGGMPEELRERLRGLFGAPSAGPDATPRAKKPPKPGKKKSASVPPVRNKRPTGRDSRRLPLFIVAAVAAAFLLVPGIWDEVFRHRSHGAIRLEVGIPVAVPTFWSNSVGARIYREVDGVLEPAGRPALRRARKQESLLISRRLYLPVGTYRVRWDLGDRIAWSSFFLRSRTEQREEGAEFDAITASLGEPPTFHLSITRRVFDAVSGNDLTETAEVMVAESDQGPWKTLDSLSREPLQSGREYRFRVAAPGYRETRYGVSVGPWRRSVHIDAALTPIPGKISVINRTDRPVTLRLNGSRRYLDAAETGPVLTTLSAIDAGSTATLVLLPGDYFIAPAGATAEGRQRTLASGEAISLSITLSSDGRPVIE